MKRNDYPDGVINSLIKQVFSNKKKTKDQQENPKKSYYLTLPYVDEKLCRKVFYILRKQDLLEMTKVTFTPGRKLKEVLTRSCLKPTKCNNQSHTTCYDCDDTCMTKNICYQLTCDVCEHRYIGETGKFKRNRTWQHYKSVNNSNEATGMGRHYNDKHPSVDISNKPFKVQIMQKCKDFVDRQITQSVLIKHLKPEINIQLSEKQKDEMKEMDNG